MRREGGDGISQQQEILLSRYVDDECGVIGRLRAQALLRKSASACEFVEGLKALKEDVLPYRDSFPAPSDNLWRNIERRIAQEEHTRFHDGQEHGSPLDRFLFGFGRLSWGAAGGFAAAGLVFAISTFSRGPLPAVATRAPSADRPVASASEGISPSVLDAGFVQGGGSGMNMSSPPPFDYLRSTGRVKVMRRSSQRSTIFWIRRKDSSSSRRADSLLYLDPQRPDARILQGD